MRRYFILTTKKCRIYAAFGVSQTPSNPKMERRKILEHVTNQKQVERQILELVKTYNVLYKRQIYAFFAVDGKEKFVGKALHTLLKEHLIYINEVTKTVSQHEDAYQLREKGTLKAFWVLLSLMEQKKIERHFLAEKEEYPIRIVFVGNAEIYDILYISEAEIQLVNQLFSRQKLDGCGHVVIVENPEEIPQIEIPNVIGFCTVQEEEGGVEYYRRE